MVSYPVGAPLPLPLRVLVKGASTVNWTSYMGGPRTDMAYPRVVEAALHTVGRPAVVRDTSYAAALTKAALSEWQSEVVPWSPDVVVLHYGQMECLHLFLPRRLQQHAQSIQTRRGPVRDVYRSYMLRPVWRLLARLQQRLDRQFPQALIGRRRRRLAADLELLVGRIRSVASPLVLLMEIDPPGDNYRDWFPGFAERIELMNETLREVVGRIDSPDVRLFPTRAVLSEITARGRPTNPDGAHYTPAGHRLIGRALAHEIATWADNQVHLIPATGWDLVNEGGE